MKYSILKDLLLLKVKALYDIESELIKALPKMAKNASHGELKQAFQTHLDETKVQKERLEKIFALLGEKPKKTKVEAIRGLVEDAKWLMDEDMSPQALDASLIAAAQYVEHYEIAGYGTARSWAEHIGLNDVANLLEKNLKEEEQTDVILTSLAENALNEEALLGQDSKDDGKK